MVPSRMDEPRQRREYKQLTAMYCHVIRRPVSVPILRVSVINRPPRRERRGMFRGELADEKRACRRCENLYSGLDKSRFRSTDGRRTDKDVERTMTMTPRSGGPFPRKIKPICRERSAKTITGRRGDISKKGSLFRRKRIRFVGQLPGESHNILQRVSLFPFLLIYLSNLQV